MRVRSILLSVVVLGLLAVPVAAAHEPDTAVVATAKGNVDWLIPLPNVFGVEVANDLKFTARKLGDGSVDGKIHYIQTVEGESFEFRIDVTCLQFYDGNRAKLGGVITWSNDATLPAGMYGWFQVFDNGKGEDDPADRSSLVGFGNEAANEAFCNSPNLPRFGPWDVQGDIKVRP
jgi:hypothetical protein